MQNQAGEALAASASDDRAGQADSEQDSEQGDRPAGRPGRPGRRRLGILWSVAVTVLGLDLASKIIAVELLANRAPIELAGGLLTLRLTRNPGAAFSIAVNMTIVLTVVAVVVILAILRMARRLHSVPWAVALGGLLGGALGNLTDRIFRSPGAFRGHVVDFLELPNWPVFNLADSAIVGAGALMVLLAFRGVPFDRPVSSG